MKASTKKYLMYGALAYGAYLLWQKQQASAATPAAPTPAPTAGYLGDDQTADPTGVSAPAAPASDMTDGDYINDGSDSGDMAPWGATTTWGSYRDNPFTGGGRRHRRGVHD